MAFWLRSVSEKSFQFASQMLINSPKLVLASGSSERMDKMVSFFMP